MENIFDAAEEEAVSQSNIFDEDYEFNDPVSKKPDEEQGDVSRGFETAFKQLPQLGYGVAAAAGATAENIFGEGGASTDLKKWGVEGYKDWSSKIQMDSKESDSLTYSWEKAKTGDYDALIDWAQYGLGYAASQGVQALATGGVGSIVGKAALKDATEQIVGSMVAKEAAKIAATEAGKKLTTAEIRQIAVKSTASKVGQVGALGIQAYGMEAGEIGGDLVSKAEEEGRMLDGDELAKAFAGTVIAGTAEWAADKIGLDLMLGKSKLFSPAGSMTGLSGRAARAGVGALAAAPIEGGTEFFQTYAEEWGKGGDITSDETLKSAIDAAGLGAIGGTAMAGAGGLLSSPTPPGQTAPGQTPPPGRIEPTFGPTDPAVPPSVVAGISEIANMPSVEDSLAIDAADLLDPETIPVPTAASLPHAVVETPGPRGIVEIAQPTPAVFGSNRNTGVVPADVQVPGLSTSPLVPPTTAPYVEPVATPTPAAAQVQTETAAPAMAAIDTAVVSAQPPAMQAATESAQPPTESVQAPAAMDDIRPVLEALVKQRRYASESGLEQQFNNAFNKAKAVMNGEEEGKANYFKMVAANFEKKGFGEIAKQFTSIHDQIKAREKANKAPRPSKLTPFADEKLNDPAYREALPHYAEGAGWAEEGGKLIRNAEGDAVGRTAWVPRADWWAGKPEGITERLVKNGVAKALKGEPMPAAEKHAVGWLLTVIEHDLATEMPAEQVDLAEDIAQETFDDGMDYIPGFDDAATKQDTAASMRASGLFTEDEINEAVNREKTQGADTGRPQESAATGEDQAAPEEVARPDLNLAGQTPEQIAAAEKKAKAEAAAKEKETADAENKARADAERDSFQLSGSSRAADANPNQSDIFGAIDDAAHQAATSPKNDLPQPTEAQKQAGNYAKGHVVVSGIPISIENPEGSKREGTDSDGEKWSVTLSDHYGYIKGTVGKDKDHIDVFIKRETPLDYSGPVFVIDQKNASGGFDEHKVMLGYATQTEAEAAYKENYSPGWDGIKSVAPYADVAAFKAWLENGNHKLPAASKAKSPKTTGNPDAAWDAAQKKSAQLDETDEWISAYAKARKWGAADIDKAWDEYVLQMRTPDVSESEFKKAYANRFTPVEAKKKSTAPEHLAVGVDDRELSEIVDEFNSYQDAAIEDGDKVTHVFDAPAKGDVVRLEQKVKVFKEGRGWMTVDEARAEIAKWKENAASQYDGSIENGNNQRIVLSLFDLTGSWSKPWEEAGYQVYRFDIQEDAEVGDVNNFSTEFFNDWFGSFEGLDVYAVLAATPCTDFASSGARHFAAKDADGRTVASVKLVHQTLATIEYFKPAVWAIENPVGRIEKLGGLPPWRLSFDPNHLGDPYTKKTLLWGRFNADLPIAPVEPTEGSKMHQKYGGKSLATKNARSVTPEGFAYGFFAANNAVDHPAMAISNKYDRLNRKAIEAAVKAGVTEADIASAVDDFYYMDLDDAAANEAIKELTKDALEQASATEDQGIVRPSEIKPKNLKIPNPETGKGSYNAVDAIAAAEDNVARHEALKRCVG